MRKSLRFALPTVLLLLWLGQRIGTASAPPLPPLSSASAGVITHGSQSERTVALTFDACETHKVSGYDARLIGILQKTHTPATLMLGGHWMESHPAATRALGADPLFELGSHSYLHPHMTQVSPARMREEMQKTQDVMFAMTGKQGTLFRPPYGEYNAQVVATAAQLGLHTMTWDVVTGDPDPHISAQSIIHTVLTRVHPGAIIIMHMNGRGWHSAEALPTLIKTLRARGYRFVTVSELIAERSKR